MLVEKLSIIFLENDEHIPFQLNTLHTLSVKKLIFITNIL